MYLYELNLCLHVFECGKQVFSCCGLRNHDCDCETKLIINLTPRAKFKLNIFACLTEA